MKIVLQIVLAAAIVLLTYMCYESVMTPIRFDKENKARTEAIKARLIDIRRAQIEYKNIHGVHAANFDELAKFLNDEKLPFVRKEGVLTDEQLEKGMTEQEAVKKGLIKRDTFWVTAKDTLFGHDYDVASIRFVPGTQKTFTMDTVTLTSTTGYTVKVFECGVLYDDYLGDLNPQLVYNMKQKAEVYEKYPGLRVGSLKEINNNAGNWE
ncbi:MAG: hypothetical protein PHG27_00625 [Massilibacteroides sp.]|nr:hypothetical protein [Massilibacteroides sp.]MDD3062085.1 hypothetical protein [Massilibacteroides sp.]MDD4114091.1 hypothetical protein [Massilibacteroides sp.]MDD4659629.1 hypothetical protein [Massilibacteroides sp.]